MDMMILQSVINLSELRHRQNGNDADGCVPILL
jgi:hypothetical protein